MLNRTLTAVCAASAFAFYSTVAAGAVPTQWTFRVLAREGPPGVALGIPSGAELVQNDPGLDNDGSAAVRFTQSGGEGIFVYNALSGMGSVVLSNPAAVYSSSVDVLNGRIALTGSSIELRDFSGALLDEFPTGGSEGVTGSFNRVRLTSSGAVGYRAAAESVTKFIVDRHVGPARIQTALASTDSSGPYSFLYSPTINDSLQMAAKVDLRAGGSAVVRYQEGQAPVTIQDLAGSPYNTISFGTDMNGAGEVAFFARVASDNTFRLLKGSGGGTTQIASGAPDNPQGITNSAFANFPPVINGAGLVAFRPNDLGNAIYLGDGQDLVRVVGAGSPIPTPGGPSQVEFLGSGSTAIVGNIALNDAAQIAFIGRLGDGTDALILASPLTCGSADFDCDGDVGTDADIEAFFACLAGTCPPGAPGCGSTADFDGDGDVGTDADIEAFFRVLAGGTC
jgi:hypothetical protein